MSVRLCALRVRARASRCIVCVWGCVRLCVRVHAYTYGYEGKSICVCACQCTVRVCIVRLCAFVSCVHARVGDGVLCECACACVCARAHQNVKANAYAYACVRAGPVHCVRVY